VASKLSIERVLKRASPDQWGEDEIMTLAEAAHLFWPEGHPVSEETLRTAVKDGILPVSIVARKIFVTKAALRALNVCKPRMSSPEPVAGHDDFDSIISDLRGRSAQKVRR
jgi:hypothetical protein